jgi:hypothetical protein
MKTKLHVNVSIAPAISGYWYRVPHPDGSATSSTSRTLEGAVANGFALVKEYYAASVDTIDFQYRPKLD